MAPRPHEVWSGAIPKRRGPAKWTGSDLHRIREIFSRSGTAWMVAHREQATLAERLIAETAARPAIAPGPRPIPAERGSSMTSQPVAFPLTDLGITRTRSRPQVSHAKPAAEAQFKPAAEAQFKPAAEAQFKPLEYRPGFPDRCTGIAAARAFCPGCFAGYNTAQRPAGLGLLPPGAGQPGQAAAIPARRPPGLPAA